jgi:hypothetical protein
VPHCHLPRLHEELARRGMLEKAEVRPLRATLARVFAARESRGPAA